MHAFEPALSITFLYDINACHSDDIELRPSCTNAAAADKVSNEQYADHESAQ